MCSQEAKVVSINKYRPFYDKKNENMCTKTVFYNCIKDIKLCSLNTLIKYFLFVWKYSFYFML